MLKRTGVLIVCIFSLAHCFAQDTASLTGFVYPPDIDSSKVDSFFKKHSINLKSAENPELYFEVYRWYKTCYRYGGSGGKGIDCSGFTNMLYEKVYGEKIPRASYLIYDICEPLGKKMEKKEGDFVFFKIRKKRVSHVGVYLQNNKFAHASTQAGVIISDLDEAYYKRYFFKAGRLKKNLPDTP